MGKQTETKIEESTNASMGITCLPNNMSMLGNWKMSQSKIFVEEVKHVIHVHVAVYQITVCVHVNNSSLIYCTVPISMSIISLQLNNYMKIIS